MFRPLIPYLLLSLRPQMATLGTISGFARPYEQRKERFYTTAHVAKTQKKVNVFLSKSFNKNSNDETLYKGNDIAIDLHDLPQLQERHNKPIPTRASWQTIPLPLKRGGELLRPHVRSLYVRVGIYA